MAESTQRSQPTTFKDEGDRSSTLFDLRYLIGGLFTFYGVLLAVASFFVSHAKSGDLDINLWLGLAMLALGLFFLGWARARPLRVEGTSALGQAEQGAAPSQESRRRPR